jgi:hypothetical protein
MNYEEMSDFEINKAVHFYMLESGAIGEKYRRNEVDFVDVFRNDLGVSPGPSVIAVMRYVKDGASDGYNPFGGAFDYCNNPSDAWQIITDLRIGLVHVNSLWRAQSLLAGYRECYSDNPLRAAMIVFLMMKEDANAS